MTIMRLTFMSHSKTVHFWQQEYEWSAIINDTIRIQCKYFNPSLNNSRIHELCLSYQILHDKFINFCLHTDSCINICIVLQPWRTYVIMFSMLANYDNPHNGIKKGHTQKQLIRNTVKTEFMQWCPLLPPLYTF